MPADPNRVAGSCSSATAPNAAPSVTQYTNSQLCQSAAGRQYWAMDLQVGDTLTVNGTPMTDSLSVDVYGPNVQTIGDPLCSSVYNGDPFTLSCLIPQAGRYLLVTRGAGQFTPGVSGVPANRSRVAGSCSSATAPNAAPSVTQYTNSQLCQSAAGRQYWAMDLQVGDTLTVNGTPMTDGLSVDVYGPNVQTIGDPLCSSVYNGDPFTLSCVIPRTGSYLLVTRGAGPFTPQISHPLLAALQRALKHWSPFGPPTLRVQASAPGRMTVCVFIVLGWRAPSAGSLSCGGARARHATVLAFGRHVFASAGRAPITVRFTRRGQRLLAAGHSRKVTLITTYAARRDTPVSASRDTMFRPSPRRHGQ